MKLRIAWLTILCLTLAAIPASAQFYDNGPINGTTDAWYINFGYIVSDTFVSNGSVSSFRLGVWEFRSQPPCALCRDTVLSLQWSITSAENGGTVYGSGTASGKNLTDTFISVNQYGYNVELIQVSGLNVALTRGSTYWLNLQNAVVPSGDPVFWDENSGKGCQSNGCPSQASESAVGTIPSEAFTIGGGCGGGNCELSGSTPEPNTILLFGSGILGVAGVLRRKLHV